MPPTLILIRHAQALHNATSDWVHLPPKSPSSLQLADQKHSPSMTPLSPTSAASKAPNSTKASSPAISPTKPT